MMTPREGYSSYPSSTNEQSFVVYRRRWWVLLSFGLLSLSSAWIWITWSPITIEMAHYWKVSPASVESLSALYMIVYVPGSIFALHLITNHIGLYKGLLVGGIFNLVGSVLRYHGWHRYRTVYFGTLLCSIAQTFTLSTPPLIAGNWFPNHERATATALGVLANQLGTALGLGVTILVDFDDGTTGIDSDVLQRYLLVQAIVSGIALFIVATLGGDKPPTPPSRAAMVLDSGSLAKENETTALLPSHANGSSHATTTKALSYNESIRTVLFDVNHAAFLVAFGLAVGVFYTIPTFLPQLLPLESSRTAGWMGVAYQFTGVLSSLAAGRLVDASQQHRVVAVWLLAGGLLSLMLCIGTLTGALDDGSAWIGKAMLLLGIAGSGASLAAWNTVGLEFGTALTYPANEAAVAGILESCAELFAFVWVTIGGYLMEIGASQFVGVLALAVLASLLTLVRTKTECKRPT